MLSAAALLKPFIAETKINSNEMRPPGFGPGLLADCSNFLAPISFFGVKPSVHFRELGRRFTENEPRALFFRKGLLASQCHTRLDYGRKCELIRNTILKNLNANAHAASAM